jgi:hypothetical protein
MKLCWDNIENIYLMNNGYFRDKKRRITYYYVESCKQCGDPFLVIKNSDASGEYCCRECMYANKDRSKKISLSQKGRKHTEETKQKLRDKANKQWGNKENRKKHSIISKNAWRENRDKIIEARKDMYNDEWKSKVSKKLKKYHENGGKIWNQGLTKETNESVRIIGEKNSKNLKGRTKKDYEYLEKHSELMKSLFKNKEWYDKHQDNRKSLYNSKEWKNKISKTITEKIKSGELNVYNTFKCGYFVRKNGNKEFYRSSLELEVMSFLEEKKLQWTTKHGIYIKYMRNDGTVHRYIPDFLIDGYIIIEMKGFPDKDIYEKYIEAIKLYEYYVCFTLDEVKEILDEIVKNKKYRKS